MYHFKKDVDNFEVEQETNQIGGRRCSTPLNQQALQIHLGFKNLGFNLAEIFVKFQFLNSRDSSGFL